MNRLTLFCLAASALPAAAQAEGGRASGGVPISVTVPEVCQIEASAISVDATTGLASGTVFEMCNSGRGFRVVASYRALEEGEQVRIYYAGETRQLDPSGISAVAYRAGPVADSVPVSVQSTGLVQDLAISLGLTVI
ncbi:hypothetical protein [Sphingosinicella humi]|uniref:Spore coat protein U domain-containing protein n=1 Tax=Allosphingosinicella humi TaxID=2068657 RepID=A0A2U2J1K4_9SPHN|nr:hypothetical protein [Sphingosinicella humi]PWG02219.1 hypothetical protein DF286_04565 [Sphingosinicella humi]